MSLREDHQLAIVCEAQAESVAALRHHAEARGLGPDELVMTGFVSDDDLLALYNLCKAFCFPSWHEGFGLPALEAMQCGAPVIGSDASSVPEVIGRVDALFNPRDEKDIAARLHQVLTDADYRNTLSQHGLVQAKKFSWEESARRAWDAFESHHEERQESKLHPPPAPASKNRPRLAYVSPLPPEQSGIADYSAELLPELARRYDIEVVMDQVDVTDPWIRANCPIRDAAWFDANAEGYDRILYHFGNSPFHSFMLQLISRHPGTVVLHDFFLSGLIEQTDLRNGGTGLWPRTLYRSHGYGAVETYCHSNDAFWRYPANLPALQNAIGVIVHSEHPRRLAADFYRKDITSEWRVLPFPRRLPQPLARQAALEALGFDATDFVVCSFGMLGRTKLNDRLLGAWLNSDLADRPGSHLVFVGGAENYPDLIREVDASAARERIRITGFASPDLFRQYLSAADVAVQLRAFSRGETSAAVLDCMGYGLPTIVNAHGSLSELPRDCVLMLNDNFSDSALTSALETLHAEPLRRKALGERARAFVARHLSPRSVADLYHQAIETSAEQSRVALIQHAVEAIANASQHPYDKGEWLALARSLNRNLSPLKPQRQLLVDVSVLAQTDSKTGIQRVTRSVLKELLHNPPAGFRVEPIYTLPELDGYRYARRFALRVLDCPETLLEDERVEIDHEDVFLGLDLSHIGVLTQPGFYSAMRRVGVKTYFVIYDLLPVLMPASFPAGVPDLHERWLSSISEYADGIIGISRSVAEEVKAWLNASGITRSRPLAIEWFHLGSDIESSLPTRGLQGDASAILSALEARLSFLMVGTIEPRKGHAQTLAAFEALWARGEDLNLVIVGHSGWNVDALTKSLRGHQELGKRLFWLEGISDEYLEQVYAASACLIAASRGEGFGLPLIEAARHKLPILARDIPVFREVAGEHASYFTAETPEDLAHAIKKWLHLFAENIHPSSDNMPWLTWSESAKRLKQLILGRNSHPWNSGLRTDDEHVCLEAASIKRNCRKGADQAPSFSTKRVTSKRILYIDDDLPIPSAGAGMPRTREILMGLVKLGIEVTFIPLQNLAATDQVDCVPTEVELPNLVGGTLEKFIESRPNFFGRVFVSRPHNMAALG